MRYAAAVERQSYSHRVIFIGLAVSLLMAMGTAFVIYEKYVKTKPVAASHLPENVTYAVRLDVEQVVSYEPFRLHLLQVFETNRREKEPRVKHLERKTTLELGIDSRELVFAQLPNQGWLILLGGVFRRDGVIAGVQHLLDDEGVVVEKRGDLLVHQSGRAFGVAGDGTLVLGSSVALTQNALEVQSQKKDDFRRALEREGTIAGVFGRSEGGEFRAWLKPGQDFSGTALLIPHGNRPTDASEFKFLPRFFLSRNSATDSGDASKTTGNWLISRAQYAEDVAELAKLLRQTVFESRK